MNRRALVIATGVGVALQLAMVVGGHFASAAVRGGAFAVGGMGFSLIAGVIYARLARPRWGGAVAGGAVAGGLCAFLGIAVSAALKDVPASLLALGTLASIVTGIVGAVAGRLVPRGKQTKA